MYEGKNDKMTLITTDVCTLKIGLPREIGRRIQFITTIQIKRKLCLIE